MNYKGFRNKINDQIKMARIRVKILGIAAGFPRKV